MVTFAIVATTTVVVLTSAVCGAIVVRAVMTLAVVRRIDTRPVRPVRHHVTIFVIALVVLVAHPCGILLGIVEPDGMRTRLDTGRHRIDIHVVGFVARSEYTHQRHGTDCQHYFFHFVCFFNG